MLLKNSRHAPRFAFPQLYCMTLKFFILSVYVVFHVCVRFLTHLYVACLRAASVELEC